MGLRNARNAQKGLSEDFREGPKINKGPLLGYIDSLHLCLPVGLQSIQFRPP